MKQVLLIIGLLFLISCGKDSGTTIAGIVYQPVPGPRGPAGADGTIVYAVQVCQNVTPSYPFSFPEVAFCINDKLYATYSALGGYSFEVIPGYYSSTAIGSACNINVYPHCVITN